MLTSLYQQRKKPTTPTKQKPVDIGGSKSPRTFGFDTLERQVEYEKQLTEINRNVLDIKTKITAIKTDFDTVSVSLEKENAEELWRTESKKIENFEIQIQSLEKAKSKLDLDHQMVY